MLAFVHTMRIKPEHQEGFLAAVYEEAAASLNHEPGCVRFDFYRSDEDPEVFFLHEVFKDADAHRAHGEAAHNVFRKLGADVINAWRQDAVSYRGVSLFPDDALWAKQAL